MLRLMGLLRILLRVFWIFPIDNSKYVLTAYNGRQFGCNPKYLALGLAEKKRNVFFAMKDKTYQLPKGIKLIKYRSLSHFYHLMTAKYIVINSSGVTDLLPYRGEQVLINTWHGGGYFKVMGIDFLSSPIQKRKRTISGNNTNFFLASCEVFAKQLPRSMAVSNDQIYRTGLPRNDILFSSDSSIKKMVQKKYNISQDKAIVLYAPTYRDGIKASVNNSGFPPINDKKVITALQHRFGKEFVFFYRAHHNMIPDSLSDNSINVSDYDDMQELLLAADVIITDYSSCMWDFSLQRKPGFLYTPDLKEYEDKHPFGTKTEDWPYSLYFSNDELVQGIIQFNEEENINKIENFQRITGSYEDGKSTQKVINELMPVEERE